MQIRAHENQSAHSRQEARNAAYLQAEEEARLKRELNEARTQLRQVEVERDDAVGQLLDLQDERRELQAQLSAKAADLRVNEGVVKQLEADLAEAHRLQRAIPAAPVETQCDPLASLGHIYFPDDPGYSTNPCVHCSGHADFAAASRDYQHTGHGCLGHCTAG